jgi:hypothetical protein
VSARGDAILEIICSDPLEWKFTYNKARHDASGAVIDLGYDWTMLQLEPTRLGALTLWDKWRIRRALANARVRQAVEKAARIDGGRGAA